MRGNDQNFNIRTHKPIEDVVRKAWYAISANIRWGFDAIPIREFADSSHCHIKSRRNYSAPMRRMSENSGQCKNYPI